MTDQRPISGTIAAAATPLRDSGRSLDEDAFEPLLEFYGASGIEGVLVLGTTGEGILLTDTERRRAAERAIENAGVLRVIVHCGAQTTADTTALAAHAARTGADGVAVIAPPYFPLGERELFEHFAAAASACFPLPFYVYEFADRSGYSVPVGVVTELRQRASNLVGMKVSDAPFKRAEPYLRTGLDVFIGAESVLLEGLANGAVGAVSGVAGAFPELVAALVRDPTPERSDLVTSLRAVLAKHSVQPAVKAALGFRGVPMSRDVRAPLRPLTTAAADQLRSDLEGLLGVDALAHAAEA